MESLPEDVRQNVALNLEAKDILSLLCVNRRMHSGVGKSELFWKVLLKRDATHSYSGSSSPVHECCGFKNLRQAYMVHAYKNCLSSVTWYPIQTSLTVGPSLREGHLACVLKGPSLSSQRRIVVNGGFTEDELVHVMNVGSAWSQRAWSWESLQPATRVDFAYGASLTPLERSSAGSSNGEDNVVRAVRFGGFRSGGYSHETNNVWILSLKTERTEFGDERLTADWQVVRPQNSNLATPRAYHSATLVAGRHLVLVGGMTSKLLASV